MTDQIVIIDFGATNTQMIARGFRNAQIYCEIVPYNLEDFTIGEEVKAVLFTALNPQFNASLDKDYFWKKLPAHLKRFYVNSSVQLADLPNQNISYKALEKENPLALKALDAQFDYVNEYQCKSLGEIDMEITNSILDFEDGSNAFAQLSDTHYWINAQFCHTEEDVRKQPFVKVIQSLASIKAEFTPENFINFAVKEIQQQVGDQKVIMAISGGVDSTVAAHLIHKAIGKNLFCFFVDTGLMRKNEGEKVMQSYQNSGLNIKVIEAKERYYTALEGVADPEEKRKVIGAMFIELFQEEANKVADAKFLGQGTIYPDIIESIAVDGSPKIKSHHNVGGLPDFLKLDLVEPLKYLFKDEVRAIGRAMGIQANLIDRHPFPGPGLGIRVLGAISPDKVKILQEADAIYTALLEEWELYSQVWQSAAILLPVQSVGAKDGKRTYEYTIAIRAVNSIDGMTAEFVHLPHEFLNELSNKIIENVDGVNRVVYDISNKPPATIEWE